MTDPKPAPCPKCGSVACAEDRALEQKYGPTPDPFEWTEPKPAPSAEPDLFSCLLTFMRDRDEWGMPADVMRSAEEAGLSIIPTANANTTKFEGDLLQWPGGGMNLAMLRALLAPAGLRIVSDITLRTAELDRREQP